MQQAYIPSQVDIDTVKRMAAHGMNLDTIAKALGIHETTLWRNPQLKKIYNQEYAKSFDKVAECALSKALQGEDSALMIFILKTRARWKEHTFIELDDFTGDYSDKKLAIDEAFREGRLSVENYEKLSKSLTDQYQVNEHEQRLSLVEKALKLVPDSDNQTVVKTND